MSSTQNAFISPAPAGGAFPPNTYMVPAQNFTIPSWCQCFDLYNYTEVHLTFQIQGSFWVLDLAPESGATRIPIPDDIDGHHLISPQFKSPRTLYTQGGFETVAGAALPATAMLIKAIFHEFKSQGIQFIQARQT